MQPIAGYKMTKAESLDKTINTAEQKDNITRQIMRMLKVCARMFHIPETHNLLLFGFQGIVCIILSIIFG